MPTNIDEEVLRLHLVVSRITAPLLVLLSDAQRKLSPPFGPFDGLRGTEVHEQDDRLLFDVLELPGPVRMKNRRGGQTISKCGSRAFSPGLGLIWDEEKIEAVKGLIERASIGDKSTINNFLVVRALDTGTDEPGIFKLI